MRTVQVIECYVRWMIARDLDSVVSIEQEAFGQHAWTAEEFRIALRQRHCIGMIAERNEEVVGYMIYELHKNRMELLNLAVRHRSQRLGVGTALIEKLKAKLAYQERNRIVLEVRERNLDAQLFFRQAGFLCTSILHGWYADSEESVAYQMQYRWGGNRNG